MTATTARARLRGWARALHWYLREVSGEADYERYLARHGHVHPGTPVLSRREFQHQRWVERARRPSGGCC